MKGLITALIIIISFSSVFGQNFDNYKWKNRLILIIAKDPSLENYLHQIKILEQDPEGLKDRKLKVFKIFPPQSKMIQQDGDNVIQDIEVYRTYGYNNPEFKVILIGLDGDIKFEQYSLLKKEKLFSLIDKMPMRQAEIRKN